MADRLTRCLNDVDEWLRASRLRLNPAKTDLVARIEAPAVVKVVL